MPKIFEIIDLDLAVNPRSSGLAQDVTPPTMPSNLQGTAISASRIDLTWGASTDTESGLAAYKVYRDGVLIATVTTTSYSDTGLGEYTQHTYQVAAFDKKGNVSRKCKAVTLYTVDTTAPGQPTGLAGNAVSISQIDLTWVAPAASGSPLSHYKVYKDGVFLANNSDLSYSATGLSEYTQYSFRVSAVDTYSNEGAQSTAITPRTLDGTAPSVPGNVTATPATPSSVDVNWDNSTDAGSGVDHYIVFRDDVDIAHPTVSNYTDTGLTSGTTYVYKIKAVDAQGNTSAFSSTSSATPYNNIAAVGGYDVSNYHWNTTVDGTFLTPPFSCSVMFHLDSLPSGGTIYWLVGRGNSTQGAGFLINASGKLVFFVGGVGSSPASATLVAGKTYCYGAGYDGTDLKLYGPSGQITGSTTGGSYSAGTNLHISAGVDDDILFPFGIGKIAGFAIATATFSGAQWQTYIAATKAAGVIQSFVSDTQFRYEGSHAADDVGGFPSWVPTVDPESGEPAARWPLEITGILTLTNPFTPDWSALD